MGVITGKVQRQVFDPSAATPRFEAVPNAMVSRADAGGQPVTASQTGANVAISQADGTFTLFDNTYQGGAVLDHRDRWRRVQDGDGVRVERAGSAGLDARQVPETSRPRTSRCRQNQRTHRRRRSLIQVYRTVGGWYYWQKCRCCWSPGCR